MECVTVFEWVVLYMSGEQRREVPEGEYIYRCQKEYCQLTECVLKPLGSSFMKAKMGPTKDFRFWPRGVDLVPWVSTCSKAGNIQYSPKGQADVTRVMLA
jgi:hypothetical protein